MTGPTTADPWRALWVMLIGFFMILVDSTIVAVANPSIMTALRIADYDLVIWVTSAYLLGFAVPLLLSGRLGDRYGPKNLYIAGLAVFTAASLWCGLSATVGMLIAARVVQGVGAALLTPQTLTTITRLFPPERRGVALSVWSVTAGVATLVGPLAGGVLVDHLGWAWIFFVNVPVGLIGLALAVRLIPALPTHPHRFDVIGVALSGAGLFLIVFALQEGQALDWRLPIWVAIGAGIALMAAFVGWQARNPREPLIPLAIFADRDFRLCNVGVGIVSFAVTAFLLPLFFYAQTVCGLSSTRAALLTAPMALASVILAPLVGRFVDRSHPRPILVSGFALLAAALLWLSADMQPGTPIWRLVLPLTAVGTSMALIWAPLGATATRNLPAGLAGAGSGVYNTTRQVGAVLGSAGMAALMGQRINAELPLATALAQSTVLPAGVAAIGVLAMIFVVGPADLSRTAPLGSAAAGDPALP